MSIEEQISEKEELIASIHNSLLVAVDMATALKARYDEECFILENLTNQKINKINLDID